MEYTLHHVAISVADDDGEVIDTRVDRGQVAQVNVNVLVRREALRAHELAIHDHEEAGLSYRQSHR